jgi:hypothetical protein
MVNAWIPHIAPLLHRNSNYHPQLPTSNILPLRILLESKDSRHSNDRPSRSSNDTYILRVRILLESKDSRHSNEGPLRQSINIQRSGILDITLLHIFYSQHLPNNPHQTSPCANTTTMSATIAAAAKFCPSPILSASYSAKRTSPQFAPTTCNQSNVGANVITAPRRLKGLLRCTAKNTGESLRSRRVKKTVIGASAK